MRLPARKKQKALPSVVGLNDRLHALFTVSIIPMIYRKGNRQPENDTDPADGSLSNSSNPAKISEMAAKTEK